MEMEAKPLTKEAIALTEKKMDMSLDDIIKMSKTNSNKGKKNRSWKFANNAAQDKNAKIRRFMDSRSSMRQGALSQRRTNFQGNQFPLANEVARKAAVAPIRNRAFNRNRSINKQRDRQPPIQRKSANRVASNVKAAQQEVQPLPKQRPQTLDSLFANMKEQRFRSMSQHNNGARVNHNGTQRHDNGGRRNGGRTTVVPWARGRFMS